MKKLLLFFSLFIFHFSFVNAQSLLNSKIPSVQVKTLDGTIINTSTFSNNGKPIVIDFWATWCKPCVAELSAIDDEYADWQKETGVKVIAVSVDDSRTMGRVQSFVREQGWTYDVYLDPNQDFQHAMEVIYPPCTFVLDGSGKIVYIHNSYIEGDEKELHAAILKAAKKK